MGMAIGLDDDAALSIGVDGDLMQGSPGRPVPSVCLPSGPSPLPCLVLARCRGTVGGGRVLVEAPWIGADRLALARSIVPIEAIPIGAQVAMAFESGRASDPIVMGVLRLAGEPKPAIAEVTSNARRLVLQAEDQIVLECGDASITLTRAGKVIIKGRHVVSQSSGVNRLKGASIDIN